MFTGIIKSLGKITDIKQQKEEIILSIGIPKSWSKVKKGDSIAINGVCLTVASIKNKSAVFFCQKMTVDITNLKYLKSGDFVNMENAMRVSDELGGHIVQGHVDSVARCISCEEIGEGYRYWIELGKNRPQGIVLKGSISLDGISLTISNLKKNKLSVDIIPFTYENTIVKFWKPGSVINVETDIIGKYVETYLKAIKNE